MLRRALALALAAAVLASCELLPTVVSPSPSSARPSASATPSSGGGRPSALVPDDMTATLVANALPVADMFDLVRRLKGREGSPRAQFEPVRTSPPNEPLGTARDFWTYDFDKKVPVRASATLRVMTEHAKWWVANDVSVDERQLATTAQVFEDRIYPTDRKIFGSEWTPGIDADTRIGILLARIPGRAAGYFSSSDELPLWVNEFSAEKEMIYINALAARLATDSLYSVLAHEFCHMIQFNRKARSVVWFNEGQAQICERANGVASGFEQTFLRQPDTQLNDWPELDDTAVLHYGASYLFLEFLRQHAGGDDLINAFMSKGIDTPADLDAVLKARGQPALEELFADFVAANAFIGLEPDARYAYQPTVRLSQPANVASGDRVALDGKLSATVHEYAARYVELPRAAAKVRFEGAKSTRVIPADPHSGRAFWWSDRADGLDSTLTRTLDLRGVRSATLSFWAWHDIEPDFDYAYVAVSTDGGTRWSTLQAPGTTTRDPNSMNLGNGFTGASGGGKEPAWSQQRIDLTPFAGKEVLLRFEYVTDGAMNLNGFAVDDIEVPEIGLRDDAEADAGWTPSGFLRSTNVVAQRFVVQLLRFGQRPTVERRVVDGGTLDLEYDASGDRRPPLLAVTGIAPRTTAVVPFSVAVDRR